jgi:hypothetical protein
MLGLPAAIKRFAARAAALAANAAAATAGAPQAACAARGFSVRKGVDAW